MEKVDINVLINEIKNGDINERYICENFESIIRYFYNQDLIEFLKLTKDIPTIRSVIKANYYTIVKQSNIGTLANALKIVQEVDPNINLKRFEDNKLHNTILGKMLWYSLKEFEEANVLGFFREVLNEVLYKENITMADFEALNSGATVVRALKFGNMVFKIGKEKEQKHMPYSEVIVPSFFRERIYSKSGEFICLCELQPFVEEIPYRYQYACRDKILHQLFDEDLRYLDDHLGNYGGRISDSTIYERYGITSIPLKFQGFTGDRDELLSEDINRIVENRDCFIIDADDIVKINGYY